MSSNSQPFAARPPSIASYQHHEPAALPATCISGLHACGRAGTRSRLLNSRDQSLGLNEQAPHAYSRTCMRNRSICLPAHVTDGSASTVASRPLECLTKMASNALLRQCMGVSGRACGYVPSRWVGLPAGLDLPVFHGP